MIPVTENLRKIRDLLADAARSAGRDPATVTLVAVSKKQPPEAVLAAADAGQRDFGENLVQEGIDKIRRVARDSLCWHFIGHLQSNKTRPVAEYFDWVHSIDRLKVAERLGWHRPAGRPPLNVCLQVNIDDEESKTGISVDHAPQLAAEVAALPNLRLRGLMCLPAIRDDFGEQRKPFAQLRDLQEALVADGLLLDTLSMGMTDDYRAAIFEGATLVRIGTAIFGPRN